MKTIMLQVDLLRISQMQLGCFGVELEINRCLLRKGKTKIYATGINFPLPRDLRYSGLEVVKHVIGVNENLV